MSTQIVVAIDGSRFADRAFEWAREEARLRDAALIVVHAVDIGWLPRAADGGALRPREHAAALDVVRGSVQRVADPDDEIEIRAVGGTSVAAALLDAARDADLLVVGRRGVGGFVGVLLGSVSRQVAAHATVPVAVIPAQDTALDDIDAAVTSVLVGVDGSPQSRSALEWAADEADLRGVPATALRVRWPIDAALAEIVDQPIDDLDAVVDARAHAGLDEVVTTVLGSRGQTVDRRVVTGRPAAAMAQHAADPSTLLVVGSRGRGGVRGALLGSVSQACLTHARGPVVVLPSAASETDGA